MYGFYEHKPSAGDTFVNGYEEEDEIDTIHAYDEDEGAWLVAGYTSGEALIQYQDGVWVQVD
jgi:hypothetical protein